MIEAVRHTDKVITELVPNLDSKVISIEVIEKRKTTSTGRQVLFQDQIATTETGRMYQLIQKTGVWELYPTQKAMGL